MVVSLFRDVPTTIRHVWIATQHALRDINPAAFTEDKIMENFVDKLSTVQAIGLREGVQRLDESKGCQASELGFVGGHGSPLLGRGRGRASVDGGLDPVAQYVGKDVRPLRHSLGGNADHFGCSGDGSAQQINGFDFGHSPYMLARLQAKGKKANEKMQYGYEP